MQIYCCFCGIPLPYIPTREFLEEIFMDIIGLSLVKDVLVVVRNSVS